MMYIRASCVFLPPALALVACLTAEQNFLGRRMQDLCDTAYHICGMSAGCVLDAEHYVEGVFPGVRRVVVATDEPNTSVRVQIFSRSCNHRAASCWYSCTRQTAP